MTKLRASMGKVELSLPGDAELLEAAGRVALAHGQLELMLRMTVKTLSGLTVDEVLNATEKVKNWQLRNEIQGLFYSKTTDRALRLKMKAILGKCEQLSGDRNRLLHNTWAIGRDGSVIMKGERHAWGPAASEEDLNILAQEIAAEVANLNKARLSGFIREVCQEDKN